MLQGLLKGAVAAAAMLCATAQADVVYNWGHISGFTNDQFNRTISMRLVLDDAAWQSGSIRYSDNVLIARDGPTLPDPASPVLRFEASLSSGLNISPRTANLLVLHANLDVNPGGNLAGSLFLLTDFAHINLSGGPLWTINNFNTDSGSGCGPFPFVSDPCTGATGRWVLDQSTRPDGRPGRVPIPGTLSLMALASFGIAAGLRKRKA